MPRKKRDEFEEYADEYGEEELKTLLELLDDFPDLGEFSPRNALRP
jgi:predicted house-cleaning noncanonical NTP pyrophosphatase (MazG superfamily)